MLFYFTSFDSITFGRSPFCFNDFKLMKLSHEKIFHSYSTLIPLIFHSYSTHIPLLFHSYSTHIPLIFHSHSTLIPLTFHSYSTHIPLTFHSYSTHIPLIFNSYSTHIPLIFHSHSTLIPLKTPHSQQISSCLPTSSVFFFPPVCHFRYGVIYYRHLLAVVGPVSMVTVLHLVSMVTVYI